jgi:hypothetical protein
MQRHHYDDSFISESSSIRPWASLWNWIITNRSSYVRTYYKFFSTSSSSYMARACHVKIQYLMNPSSKLTSCEFTYGYGMHAWPAIFAFLDPPSQILFYPTPSTTTVAGLHLFTQLPTCFIFFCVLSSGTAKTDQSAPSAAAASSSIGGTRSHFSRPALPSVPDRPCPLPPDAGRSRRNHVPPQAEEANRE